jgi:hypothetical protein
MRARLRSVIGLAALPLSSSVMFRPRILKSKLLPICPAGIVTQSMSDTIGETPRELE